MPMNTRLVEIQPRELRFIIEVKKYSSCAVHLTNVTDQYVAFKVKTTSPKKYCVRPNVGVIQPNSTCEVTVTMQIQKTALSEMQCKDKFLIQRSVVPFGTTEEEMAPGMVFAKDGAKYIEESKLRVVLMSTPDSPVMQPVNGVLSEQTSYETLSPKYQNSSVLLPLNGIVKQEPSCGATLSDGKLQSGVENHPPPDTHIKQAEVVKNVKTMEESKSGKVIDNMKSSPAKLEDFYRFKNEASARRKEIEESNLKLAIVIEELKLSSSAMHSKLVEAEHTIKKLNEEKTSTVREKDQLKQELVIMRIKGGLRTVRVGFSPSFVCLIAVLGLIIGISFRA